MKAVVAAFNQEKALEGAFSVITNLRMELFGALASSDALILLPMLVVLQTLNSDEGKTWVISGNCIHAGCSLYWKYAKLSFSTPTRNI